MDSGDRYLNAKNAKTLMREDKVEEATTVTLLFTRDPISNDFIGYIQCMWYEIEASNAYLRSRKFVKSFNICTHLVNHFYQFIEDQVIIILKLNLA